MIGFPRLGIIRFVKWWFRLRIQLVILAVAIWVALFFPTWEAMEISGHHDLWTSRASSGHIQYSNCSERYVPGPWFRLRLGLPTKPTTVDFNLSEGAVQFRLEPLAMVANLVFCLVSFNPIAVAGYLLFLCALPFRLIFAGANYLMERCEPYELADDYYD